MQEKEPVRVLVTAPLGVGGVTNMMINIQSHLDRSKVNFDYLVFHDRKEALEDKVASMGSRKLIASVDHISVRPLRRLLRINEIRKVCKENKIQILHYNADSAADVTNILGAKLGGVKYVTIHSHNAGFGTAGKGVRMVSKLLQPFIPALCNNYWGCSDLAARFLFPKSIIEAGNYAVLPNGIELEKYDYNEAVRKEMRTKLGLEDRFVVGHAGRFSDQKNHTFLLDIFKDIARKNDKAVLLLFGVGELVEPMKEKAKRLGIQERVIFYGASSEMEKMYQAKAKVFAEFLKTNLAMSDLVYDRDNVQKANQEFDTFLVGSDLVWDFSINQNDLTYMLDFADKDAVKIAYASSVGTMWESEDRETVKNLLKRFQNIGVREHSIQKELDILIGKKVDFVCDPTMLLTAEQWKSMSAPRNIEGDYVLCYMSDSKLEMYKDAIQYGKKHHLPVYLISYGWVPEGMKAIRPNGVEEFISLVSNAHTVFTASYHGMLFSLYFNRNFYYYNRGWKERMKSIAEYLQLTDREHWSDEKDSAVIDYTLVNERLNSFRTSSLRLLKEYLRRKNL